MEQVRHNYINLSYLETMSSGDADIKRMLLDELFNELPSALQQLASSASTEDWEELEGVSHKTKSTLPFIGNEEMIKANLEILELSRLKKDLPKIHKNILLLEEMAPKAIEELKIIYSVL